MFLSKLFGGCWLSQASDYYDVPAMCRGPFQADLVWFGVCARSLHNVCMLLDVFRHAVYFMLQVFQELVEDLEIDVRDLSPDEKSFVEGLNHGRWIFNGY